MTTSSKQDAQQWYYLIPFICIVSLSSYTLYQHTMWRDEYHAWLIVFASESVPHLLSNLKHEGHPLLWYLLLFGLQGISDSVSAMKLLHWFIAFSSLCLIFFASPFTKIQRLLICCSATFSFEYFLFSRSYAVGALFILLYCFLSSSQNMKQRHLLRSSSLAIAANASIYSLFLSLALGVHHLRDLKKKSAFTILFTLLPLLLGASISLYTMYPAADTVMPLTLIEGKPQERNWILGSQNILAQLLYGSDDLAIEPHALPKIKRAVTAHLVIPFFPEFVLTPMLKIPCVLLLITLWILLLKSRQCRWEVFWLYHLMAIPFFYLVFQGYYRHYLMSYVAFIATLWLSPGLLRGPLKTSLSCLLSLQTFMAFHLFYHEHQKPRSGLPEVMSALETRYSKEELHSVFLIAMKTMNASGLAAHYKRPLYNPTRDEMQYFRKHDGKSLQFDYDTSVATKNIFQALDDSKEPALFVTNFEAMQDTAFLQCLELTPLVVPDGKNRLIQERFWGYQVKRKKIATCTPTAGLLKQPQ